MKKRRITSVDIAFVYSSFDEKLIFEYMILHAPKLAKPITIGRVTIIKSLM